jgi:hypothetical protein
MGHIRDFLFKEQGSLRTFPHHAASGPRGFDHTQTTSIRRLPARTVPGWVVATQSHPRTVSTSALKPCASMVASVQPKGLREQPERPAPLPHDRRTRVAHAQLALPARLSTRSAKGIADAWRPTWAPSGPAHRVTNFGTERRAGLIPGSVTLCIPALPCNPDSFSLLFALGRSSANSLRRNDFQPPIGSAFPALC